MAPKTLVSDRWKSNISISWKEGLQGHSSVLFLALNSLNNNIQVILHPKHSTSGKTRKACFLGGDTKEADPAVTHMTSIVLETQQVGGLAGSPLRGLQLVWVVEPGLQMKSGREGTPNPSPYSKPLALLAGPFRWALLVFSSAADFSHSNWGEGRQTYFSEACWPSYLNWTVVELKLEWITLICWIMNPVQNVFSLTVKKPSLSP